ncbi:MAG: hypothetical protein ISEC1_P1940 [Thiomicrorhabdus sp.]|nr:MAG: hypothetical protein ISEC1_P1940 [Thiomicrorhabdus sp.]
MDDWGTWSQGYDNAPLATSESQGIWGFTESDWFSDVKQVAGLWGFVENAGQLKNAGQNQADQMYAVPVQNNPNAQYIDPTAQPTVKNALSKINTTYVIAGIGVLALAYLAIK